MSYQNNNYDNNQQVHVSTNTVTMFSGDMMLRINLYDQNMSFGFTTAVTESDTGKRRFPKENAVNALLTADRVTALYTIIKNRTLPALENKTPRSDSLMCNRDGSTIIGIEVTPEMLVNLTCYSGIGDDRIPKRILTFTFQDISSITNYNANTGDFTADETPIRAQFLLFLNILEGFQLAYSGAVNHFGRYYDRYTNRRMMSSIDAMASKMGVQTVNGPMYNNAVSGTNVQSGGNFNPNMSVPNSDIPVNNVSNLNDMFGADNPY